MSRCIIAVPAYSPEISYDERKSLEQLKKVLGNYDINLVCPEGMDVSKYAEIFGELWTQRFPGKYFTDRMAYCKLVCGTEFYERFQKQGYEYVLIYQTDCWVFRDELEEWLLRNRYETAEELEERVEDYMNKKDNGGRNGRS